MSPKGRIKTWEEKRETHKKNPRGSPRENRGRKEKFRKVGNPWGKPSPEPKKEKGGNPPKEPTFPGKSGPSNGAQNPP